MGSARYESPMTRLILLLIVVFLSACSMDELAEQLVPSEVRADADQLTTDIMAGEFDSLRAAFPGLAGPEFESALGKMAEEVRGGTEISRGIVGVSANASTGTEGSSRNYIIAHEVETEAGFTTVSQTWAGEGDEAVALTDVNVVGSDTSTIAALEQMGRIARYVGLGLLLGGSLLVFLLVLRSRRRAQAA